MEVLNDLIASDSITKDSNGTWITNPAITPATASFPPSGVFEMGGDQDETKIIPGPKGDTGATGATGPAGSSGSGGSSTWTPPDFDVEELPRPIGLAHASSHKLAGGDAILLHELGLPTGSVDFNGQQALSIRFENRTSDPGSPATGQVWLRTDL